MELFKDLPAREKDKIYFIHFNHTNPLLNPTSEQAKMVIKNGFHIAGFKEVLGL
jgi:pyrroloquinoline quinone biosynthesis protein B